LDEAAGARILLPGFVLLSVLVADFVNLSYRNWNGVVRVLLPVVNAIILCVPVRSGGGVLDFLGEISQHLLVLVALMVLHDARVLVLDVVQDIDEAQKVLIVYQSEFIVCLGLGCSLKILIQELLVDVRARQNVGVDVLDCLLLLQFGIVPHNNISDLLFVHFDVKRDVVVELAGLRRRAFLPPLATKIQEVLAVFDVLLTHFDISFELGI
jgi:hypothetical protein